MQKINAFIAITASACFMLPAVAGDVLKVDARVTCDKPAVLSVSLENESSSSVEIDESLLPWNHFNVIRLEAYQVFDGKSRRLVGVSPIADYLRKIRIAPGKKLTGEIYFNRSFAAFDESNSAGDILVFYRINSTVRTGTFPFFGSSGTVLVPKKNFFSQGCPVLVKPRLSQSDSERKGSG